MMDKKLSLNKLTLTIISITLLLWVLTPDTLSAYRFSSLNAILSNLGKIAGLIGINLLSINMFISSRIPIIEKYFESLDKAYLKHKKQGVWAYIFILIHPVLLTTTYTNLTFKSLIEFFKWQLGTPKTYGSVSLTLFTILIFLTIYLKKKKYHLWKLTHEFMALAFLLGSIHTLLIPSDISRNIIFKIYIFLLIFIALSSYIYKKVLYKWGKKFHKFIVVNKKTLNSEVIELKLKSLNTKLKFLPGQFIFIKFISKNLSREIHPFTISCAPNNSKIITLSIKNLGDFTSKIKEVKKGDIAEVEGPFGSFSYLKCKHKHQIWVAGGIGITPFKSMAEHLEKQKNSDYKIILFYSVKTIKDAVYLKELKNIDKTNTNFKLVVWETKKLGFLNAQEILKTIKFKYKEKQDFLICGPPKMMRDLKEQLANKNIPTKNIHIEEFGF